ncbi:MAG: hypothetical protein IKZ08_02695 [Bacteroidales bacterium]|nr:hypothetical protein [Bacteroidales bacterium]
MEKKHEATVYGTVVKDGETTYVRIDGSELLTPVAATAEANDGERVSVLIKDHTATITGNASSPAARTGSVLSIGSEVVATNILLANKADISDLDVVNARIDDLDAGSVTIDDLTAVNARIGTLETDYVTVNGQLTAHAADIVTLTTDKLDASTASVLYANIDFTNIGTAAMEYFYSKSGLISDVVVGDQTITGELVGVTVNGDRLIGNTVIADKLVIKGSDGLYYKLNTDGMKTEAEQTNENSLDGTVIKAKSITATKISVSDLVAFGATIGGFHITDGSIYSGTKESVDNATRGIYLGKDAQVAIGDANNFIKYYKDTDGNYRLAIAAESLSISGGTDVGIGGRNYLLDTSNEWSGEYIVSGWQNYRYYGSDMSHVDLVGQTVTFSGYIQNVSGSNVGIMLHVVSPDLEQGFWQATSVKTIPDGTTGFISQTVTIPSEIQNITDVRLALRHYANGIPDTRAKIRSWKLEKGGLATDWTPAPEDVGNRISTSVEGISVGGRNLIRNTDFSGISNTDVWTISDGVATANGVVSTTTVPGVALYLPLSEYACKTCRNKEVVVTLEYFVEQAVTFGNTNAWVGAELSIVRSDSSKSQYLSWYGNKTFPTAVTNKWQKHSIVFSISDHDIKSGILAIYMRDASGRIKLRHPKVEIGNKPTDWSIAPEDVQNGIDEASKTASNFMHYDATNGLQVGNKSSGSWSGFRSQITGVAFNILNAAGTVLASYGEKLIELGKNATDAIIKLCGGKGQIEYATDADTGDNYLQMSADKLRLKSSLMSSLYSMYTDQSSRWEKSATNVSPTKVSMYASKCVDPTMVDKVEGWDTSTVDVNSDHIDMSTPGYVSFNATDGYEFDGGALRDTHGQFDSVVQGVSGIWSYRKMVTGHVELWGVYDISNLACNTAIGNLYRTAVVVPNEFPFNVYDPKLVATYESDGYGAMLWATTATSTSKPPSYYLIRPTSTTIAHGKIIFHVRGKWKT